MPMKKNEVVVGHKYIARVSGKLVTVRVDAIHKCESRSYGGSESLGGSYASRHFRSHTIYDVTNLTTGRQLTFQSAAKLRKEVTGL